MIFQTSSLIFFISVLGTAIAKPQTPDFEYRPQWTAYDKSVQNGILAFGHNLLKNLRSDVKNEKNILVSPVNIYSALNMVYLGSGGKTLEELSNVLGLPDQKDHSRVLATSESLGKIVRRLEYVENSEYSVNSVETLAFGVFIEKYFSIINDYLKTLKSYFSSAIARELDFAHDREHATKEINNWISDKTKHRIPTLYNVPLPESTLVVLVSTLYFSAKWIDPFPETKTKIEKFNIGSSKIDVKMMTNVQRIPYTKNTNLRFEAIRLAYRGDGHEMIFILPDESEKLDNLVQNLKVEDLQAVFDDSGIEGIEYKIPKTKFSWSQSLKSVLMKLGLQATLSGTEIPYMINSTAVEISDVHHATEIEMDEQGIVASAVTGIVIVPVSLPPPPPKKPKPFHVNRPFMMMLYHRPSNTVQFSALIYNPTK